tara:strand:+ start:226 stop:705 length:480 start_codon:yes stop_codon:yes gene_type:complete
MKITIHQIREMVQQQLDERCQKGYKTHPTRKTKKMFGRTYRNCVKAESQDSDQDDVLEEKVTSGNEKIDDIIDQLGTMADRSKMSDFYKLIGALKSEIKFNLDKGLGERKLTKSETSQKEKLAKKYKPAMQSFKDQYGDEAESVYYATMTKKAKEGEKA